MSSALQITALQGSIADLASRSFEAYLIKERRYAKCRVCGHIYPPRSLGKSVFAIDCTTCNYSSVVCKDCGGIERAKRGIKCHVMYYMREKSIDIYGNQHNPAYQSSLRTERRDRKFGVIQGGKS